MALPVQQMCMLVLLFARGAHSAREACKPDVNGTLGVKYGSINATATMELSDVQEAPSFILQSSGHYLLLMVDPDAPKRDPICTDENYFLHWMKEFTVENRKVINEKYLIEYLPPSPPVGSGYHRYQFLLYDLGDAQVPQDKVPTERYPFILKQFVTEVLPPGRDEPLLTFQFKAKKDA